MMPDSPHKASDIAPTADMPTDEFRRYGHALVDWIADHFDNIDRCPVLPAVKPGEMRNQLPAEPPAASESMSAILRDIDDLVMPAMTHWNHPNFFAYFSITGSGPGILGELLASAFNINGMLWKSCPASTELEQTTLDWLRQLLGLPDQFWGIIYDTASVSTLHAIAAAREQLSDLEIREKGMSGRQELPRLRLYASEQAHSSIDKAAIALGIGLEGIRKIPVDSEFRMISSELASAIAQDRADGWQPFCVVATVGTTSTTSIDPVTKIAEICQAEQLWLHVDAAYGGSAAVVPEMRHVLGGCNAADSICVNPHKWLFVPVDLSAFYTRKPAILKQAFSLIPEYLRTTEDDKVENYMDYGLQLGRRFRALKLWFVLRYFGADGLAQRIREHLRLAQMFASWVREDANFEMMAPVPFSTVCFRARPAGFPESELNDLNRKLMEHVNATREAFLSHTRLNDIFTLRLAIGNLRTKQRHVEQVWQLLRTHLRRLIEG